MIKLEKSSWIRFHSLILTLHCKEWTETWETEIDPHRENVENILAICLPIMTMQHIRESPSVSHALRKNAWNGQGLLQAKDLHQKLQSVHIEHTWNMFSSNIHVSSNQNAGINLCTVYHIGGATSQKSVRCTFLCPTKYGQEVSVLCMNHQKMKNVWGDPNFWWT